MLQYAESEDKQKIMLTWISSKNEKTKYDVILKEEGGDLKKLVGQLTETNYQFVHTNIMSRGKTYIFVIKVNKG